MRCKPKSPRNSALLDRGISIALQAIMTTAARTVDTQTVGRILAIADEPDTVEVMRDYFGAIGYDVRASSANAEAVMLIHQEQPDVIFLDVEMPRLTEVFRHLRPRCPEVPMIVAAENGQIAKRLRPLGAFAYIQKPFDWDELRRRIALVIYSALRCSLTPARPR